MFLKTCFVTKVNSTRYAKFVSKGNLGYSLSPAKKQWQGMFIYSGKKMKSRLDLVNGRHTRGTRGTSD